MAKTEISYQCDERTVKVIMRSDPYEGIIAAAYDAEQGVYALVAYASTADQAPDEPCQTYVGKVTYANNDPVARDLSCLFDGTDIVSAANDIFFHVVRGLI